MELYLTNNEKIDWLKAIYPEFKTKKWHNENVFKPSDLNYFEFFEESRTYTEKINPSSIVGIAYFPNYNFNKKIIWFELFYELTRLYKVVWNFKNWEALVSHINTNIDLKTVSKFGNHFFTTSGQHRLCLAKFLDLKSIEVEVREYKLNKQKVIKWRFLKKQEIIFKMLHLVSEESNFETYINREVIVLSISQKHIYLKQEMVDAFLDYYQNFKTISFLKPIHLWVFQMLHFEDNSYGIEINSKQDLKKLNALILQHKFFN
jgi:hypothetical protein